MENIKDFDELPMFLTPTQVSKVLNLGKNNTYDLLRCGQIRNSRIGHQIRISKAALLEFLQKSEE